MLFGPAAKTLPICKELIQSKSLSALPMCEAGILSIPNTWAKGAFSSSLVKCWLHQEMGPGHVPSIPPPLPPHVTLCQPNALGPMGETRCSGWELCCGAARTTTWMTGEQSCRIHHQLHYVQVNTKPQRSGEKNCCFPLFRALFYFALPLLHLPEHKVPSKGFLKS